MNVPVIRAKMVGPVRTDRIDSLAHAQLATPEPPVPQVTLPASFNEEH